MKSTQFARALVLSGIVTLASSLGSVTGGANELLAAEPGQVRRPIPYARRGPRPGQSRAFERRSRCAM